MEHAAGDFAVLVQLDHSVECAAGDLAISADDILESAACDGAVFIHVDILLEGAVLNDGVLRTNRALCHDAGDGHICKSDLLHGNGHLIFVDGTRSKIHRVAVRGGDVERRACPSVLFHGGVLPAQTLIEVSRHALAAHRHTGHTGQVGQTLFGNAQRLEVAWIGGLIHKDLCAVILAGNAQHLAVGRGVGVVAADRCVVDAQHIGVQGKFCAACAHQIDGIGGKRQSSAVHRSHTAVAHHQRAELLSCGQQLLDAVRQFAQNRIRNGVGVIAIGIEIAALDHRIGDRARAIAVQGIKGTAVNGAQIQLHIGVAAAQNADAVHIVGLYQKYTGDSAIQQINRVTVGILDGHIAADRAVQNVLGISTAGTGDGQSGGFFITPAGTGCCLGQTVLAGLDLDHLIICFRVLTNSLMLFFGAVSNAVGLFRRGRKPCPCIRKCGYREDGEHHTERQYHAHDAFFHDILSFVG